MEECKEKSFPDVETGDVVRFIEDGDIYLVARINRESGENILRLIGLADGVAWSYKDLWGEYDSNEWEKVNVCYKVND